MNYNLTFILGAIISIADFMIYFKGIAITIYDIHIGFFGTLLVLYSGIKLWRMDPTTKSNIDRLLKHRFSAPTMFISSFAVGFDMILRRDLVIQIIGYPFLMLANLVIAIAAFVFLLESFIHVRFIQQPVILDDGTIHEDFEVFISYSSKEKLEAEKLHFHLLSNNINSWISSQNIDSGEEYGLQIVKAIDETHFFVLLVSPNSVESRHVLTELERSFSSGSKIYPILIEKVVIPQGWEYYLSTSQWMDATAEHKKHWMDDLIDLIRDNLPED